MAQSQPAQAALKIPRGRTADGRIDYLVLSFDQLDGEVDAWCRHLVAKGVRRGDRTLVMVRQGLPLIASVFALFKLGAVPVVIDPGMGLGTFLRCVRHARPRALVGIPLALAISRIAWRSFRTLQIRVGASTSLTASRAASDAEPPVAGPAELAATTPSELAAILFTSGSTGAPKGVWYTHGMFDSQVELIRAVYGIVPGEVDLPLLPIFALFNPALGMTTIVPEIDPRRPAKVDPAKIIQAVNQEKVTNSFGSPTLWRKIAEHAQRHQLSLPSVRRVLCAGAPVSPALWEASRNLLPNGELHSPYGATEALPVSTICAREVLSETAAATLAGAGTCVGRPVPGVEVRIIPLTDAAILSDAGMQPGEAGIIGEIVVRGPNVTQAYDALPEATSRAKIPSAGRPGEGFWHRMGDCGYLDEQGRLWFCGRKAERVETASGPLFTEQVEPLINQHPAVRRSALVGVGPAGRQQPWVVVELAEGFRPEPALVRDLERHARRSPLTARIEGFRFHPGFPVDVRHNAKIHRLTLARWVATTPG